MFQNLDEALMTFVNGLSVFVFFAIVGYHYITVRGASFVWGYFGSIASACMDSPWLMDWLGGRVINSIQRKPLPQVNPKDTE